jgi:hypothetical protein
MATLAPRATIWKIFSEPLRGWPLIAAALVVWLAGAGYCHGYERLLEGSNEWDGSLIWSAVAIMPWFALFEWSKQPRGSNATGRPLVLAGLVLTVAALSIILEYAWHLSLGEVTDRLGFLIFRRMPPLVATVVLIHLTRKSATHLRPMVDTESLESLARLTEYVAAADNYIELHLPGRVALRRMTLTEAAHALKRQGFVRIHRRYLVNRDHVVAIQLNGRRSLRLRSGAELPIGSAYAVNAAPLMRDKP